MSIDDLVARVKAVATSLVTLAVAAQTALVVFADDIVELLPGDTRAASTAAAVAVVVGGLGNAIAVLRHLTRVPASQVGVVSPPPGS